MAAAYHRTVTVAVEPVLHEPGHWCDRCLLPSMVLSWFAVRFGPRMHLQAWMWCDDCGTTRRARDRRDDW